jgi:late competence protein required for DNA uptake (superfamily II DNA/RNA helicase)
VSCAHAPDDVTQAEIAIAALNASTLATFRNAHVIICTSHSVARFLTR